MKRLLLVTHTFYPNPVVGSVRATELARRLPALGWDVTVVTRGQGHFEPALEGVETVFLDRERGAPPAWRARVKGRLARSELVAALAVPDLSVRAWEAAVPRIAALGRERGADAVLTTSPTHSVHAVGRALRRAGLPWIADFRDPYLADPRFRPRGLGRLRAGAHRRFERAIYEEADRVVHALPLHARWARRRYRGARERIRLITNGFPDELPVAGGVRRERPRIAAVGSSGARELEALARATARLGGELRLAGPRPPNEGALRAALGERLVVRGPIPHAEALREIASADVLVACLDEARAETLALTSRLFEYLATGLPVLVINPTRSDRLFLRRMPHVGRLAAPTPEGVARAIEALPAPDPAGVARYRAAHSRSGVARGFAALLGELA